MKKILYTILLVYLCFAEQVEILNLPVGKSFSLAGEVSLVDSGAFSVVMNPSMLAMVQSGFNIEYNKILYFADTSYDIFGFSFKERTAGVDNSVAVVLGKFTSGKIKVRNIEGELTGEEAEYSTTLAAFGFSSVLTSGKKYHLWLGLSGYGLRESINTNSQYWGGNIGLLYLYRFGGDVFKSLKIGAVVRGLGTNSNLTHSEALGLELKRIKFIIGYENYIQKKLDDNLKFGISANVYSSKDLKNSVVLNLGYGLGNYIEIYSSGIGIKINRIVFDYSFTQHKYLGNLHGLLVSIKLTH
ncbi:MAG: hypothetical protein NZ928_03085 [Endomicrobia bacterium]|nr:hypothetical protein [Endomicrobiia bacterium]